MCGALVRGLGKSDVGWTTRRTSHRLQSVFPPLPGLLVQKLDGDVAWRHSDVTAPRMMTAEGDRRRGGRTGESSIWPRQLTMMMMIGLLMMTVLVVVVGFGNGRETRFRRSICAQYYTTSTLRVTTSVTDFTVIYRTKRNALTLSLRWGGAKQHYNTPCSNVEQLLIRY